jgi:hypothetical protein
MALDYGAQRGLAGQEHGRTIPLAHVQRHLCYDSRGSSPAEETHESHADMISAAMEDTSVDLARARPCSIILVHGTWGRGFFPKRRKASLYPPDKRRWFEEGSHFCASLEAALKNASLE